jgi:hypothetical protein
VAQLLQLPPPVVRTPAGFDPNLTTRFPAKIEEHGTDQV